MTADVQILLDSFERLPEIEKKQFAVEILRRVGDFDSPPLSDEDLVLNAEAIFLELDRQETADDHAEAW
jgi:hypothetical protein